MKYFFKKGMSFALALTLVITMCFGSVGTAKAYASDSGQTLSVYDGDKLVKVYTLDDLKAIAKAEGDIKYKFSGYNRNPSFYVFGDPDNEKTPPKKDVQEVTGPTVAGILSDAGVTYNDDQLISFKAADGVTESFIAGDLFTERYYFPNGQITIPYVGTPPTEENYSDAEPVVPVIDLHRSDDWETVLRFGQIAPNEQNNAAYVKYVADGGAIIVGDVQTEAWEAVTTANYSSGVILPETEIEFNLPKSITGKKVQVYFTTDGTEPGYGDDIYNYDKYGGVQKIVLPEDEGTVTYKVKVAGYGKLDSEVTTFTYEVKDLAGPAVPADFAVIAPDSSAAVLTWTPAPEATYYEVLKYDAASGKHIVYAQTAETVYTDTAVSPGEEVSYQVRAVRQLNSGQLVYGSAAAKQATVIPAKVTESEVPDEPAVSPEDPSDTEEPEEKPAPPTVAKPTLKSVAKTGYAGIQVKWSKVEGADGYQVWRYDAVSKKYKVVKTITNGSTVSWKNTGLKTGRKYTYKVRAYVNFDGDKVFSKYSGTKVATPALSKPVISKLTAGKNSVTVKWKKVAGANGYKIYRATSKNGKYTCVKTIKKGGTLSWKNTKLKKGKKYYYKVKAYRIVDKKNVYSNMSLSKYAKSK